MYCCYVFCYVLSCYAILRVFYVASKMSFPLDVYDLFFVYENLKSVFC